MSARHATILFALVLAACLGDPVGPGMMSVSLEGGSADTVWTGAPGEALPELRIKIQDADGHPIPGATVTWESRGKGSTVAGVTALSNAAGEASARWWLGTDAAEEQHLQIAVQTARHGAQIDVRARAVPHVVGGLRVSSDTVLMRLGDTLTLQVDAVDPYGNVFPAPDLATSMSDTTLGSTSGALLVAGPRRGRGEVLIGSHGAAARVPVHVTQYVAAIVPARDTVVFASLGAELPVSYVVRDDRGRQVKDTSATLSISDTNIVSTEGIWLHSVAPGKAIFTLELSPARAAVSVVVDQRIASLRLMRDTIRFDALSDTTTLRPVARDSLGSDVRQPAVVFQVQDPRVAALTDAQLLKSITPGVTTVTVRDPQTGVSSNAPVVVDQLVRSIDVSPVTFDALGDTATPAVTPRDRLGVPVLNASLRYSVSDSTIAQVGNGGVVRSRAPGHATLTIQDDQSGITAVTDIIVQQRIASLALERDSIAFDALLDTTRLTVIARDRLGALVDDVAARTTYLSTDPAVVAVDANGLTRSRKNGSALVIAQSVEGPSDTVQVTVLQRLVSIAVSQDTLLFAALGAKRALGAAPLDRLGSPVSDALITYSVDDPLIARIDATGLVVAVVNGSTRVRAEASGVTKAVEVRVAQRPVRVSTADTIHLAALGDTTSISATALDSLGSPVSGSMTELSIVDTSVVLSIDSTTIRARANGATAVNFAVAGLAGSTVVEVRQVADSVVATVMDDRPILALRRGELIPLSCRAFDRNRFLIENPQFVVTSAHGKFQGSTCGDLVASNTGFDTASVRVNNAAIKVPLLIAVGPIAAAPTGNYLALDSFPIGALPWAPSIWQNPGGQIELFTTVYYPDSTRRNVGRGDLHRYVSSDGVSFRYDGVVLQHDSTLCALNGSGIENVTIVPRQDSTGWRMFYAGGSFSCYGWQVFSAVSADGRTWTKEPGIRLSNGGPVPPAPSQVPPYPVGEGMAIDVLPSGAYRMIVGSFEHVSPPPVNQWQITEWQSVNQADWTYVGTVLTTRDMPVGAQGSVYSPSIVEAVPGLWRMFFTADDRPNSGSRSAVWSAVSTDHRKWIIEGPIAGAGNTDLFYATVLDNRLYFIRRDVGGTSRLAFTSLDMK